MVQTNAKFSIVVVYMSIGMFGRTGWLHAAAYQTDATCSEDWSWMNNQNGSSPCLTAAAISQPCFSDDFQVVSLGPHEKYTEASMSYNNKCYCSWAVYNLIQACTICQGLYDAVLTWSQWSQSCSDNLTPDRAYPLGFSIPDSYTFPRWAATDPTTWNERRFNAQQAQQVRNSKPGDLPDPSPPSTHTNVGAIAGGVVGGVLVLAIGIAAAILLYCHHKKARHGPHMSQAFVGHHVSYPSNTSVGNHGIGIGYNLLLLSSSPSNDVDNRVMNSPKTLRTHNPSRSSLLTQESPVSFPGSPSTQQGNHIQPTFTTPHGIVSPFPLERPLSQDTSSRHERKMSEVSISSGSAAAIVHRDPPAYSEAPQGHGHGDFSSMAPDEGSSYGGSTTIITAPPGNFPIPVHERGSSVGTIDSNISSTSAGLWTHSGIESLYSVADLLGFGDAPGPTGPTISNAPRGQKRTSRLWSGQ